MARIDVSNRVFTNVKTYINDVCKNGIGIVLCAIWVFANTSIGNSQEVALATFTAIVQGILVAGLSTYADQIMKQIGKED